VGKKGGPARRKPQACALHRMLAEVHIGAWPEVGGALRSAVEVSGKQSRVWASRCRSERTAGERLELLGVLAS